MIWLASILLLSPVTWQHKSRAIWKAPLQTARTISITQRKPSCATTKSTLCCQQRWNIKEDTGNPWRRMPKSTSWVKVTLNSENIKSVPLANVKLVLGDVISWAMPTPSWSQLWIIIVVHNTGGSRLSRHSIIQALDYPNSANDCSIRVFWLLLCVVEQSSVYKSMDSLIQTISLIWTYLQLSWHTGVRIMGNPLYYKANAQ